MKTESGRWGINMKRWCREHERSVTEALASGRWDAGLLEGKRPYFLECWSTCGVTMLTYFVSAEGLGRYGQKKAVKLLEDAGLFRILDPENPRTSVMEFRDGSGRRFYSVNVALGDENGTYAAGGRCWAFSALNRYNRKRKKEAG